MWIMTKRGWQRIVSQEVIPAPAPPPRIPAGTPLGYADYGFKSYVGWLRRDYNLIDPL